MITVLHPGPLTTVQDRGRPGWGHLGVTGSGAADRASAARAHRLVGNPLAAALLETVLGGLILRTDTDTVVAATGTTAAVTVDGRRHPTGRVLVWPAGTTLALSSPPSGLRTYLAVRGGLDVAPVLGSRSTDTLGGLGPPPLTAGDRLAVGADPADPPARHDTPEGVAAGTATSPLTLDATRGPRAGDVDLAELTRRAWTVGTDLDRVGVRLAGDPLALRRTDELPSEGVVRGAVQVPPSGLPVLFGADHPTTGGYPVVAVLTARACDAAAQARPGTAVRLRLREPSGPLAMMAR